MSREDNNSSSQTEETVDPSHHSVAASCPQPSTHGSAVFSVPLASVGDEPFSHPVQHQKEAAHGKSSSDTADALKKHGVKGTSRRRSRPSKQRMYQMGPQEDKEMEKRRKKAIITKLHRDKEKEEKANMVMKLDSSQASHQSKEAKHAV